MKISRDNYEIWFLDYQEGRLDETEMEWVRIFVGQNPDLSDELDSPVSSLKIAGEIVFPGKERLKKEQYDDPALLETFAVAAFEGDLDELELSSLEEWLTRNPAKREILHHLEKTRLRPDAAITFGAKERLKKTNPARTLWMRLAPIAAVLLIAFFLFSRENKNITLPHPINVVAVPRAVTHPQDNNAEKKTADISVTTVDRKSEGIHATPIRHIVSKVPEPEEILPEPRLAGGFVQIEARTKTVCSIYPENYDLKPVKVSDKISPELAEIPISEFLNEKLREIKANSPKGFFTREEMAVAGLHFFSLISGKHLTGKRGDDGRLTSISLNTQLLAVSVPVNR